MIGRWGILAGLGLLAAPAIIRTPGLLMPIKPLGRFDMLLATLAKSDYVFVGEKRPMRPWDAKKFEIYSEYQLAHPDMWGGRRTILEEVIDSRRNQLKRLNLDHAAPPGDWLEGKRAMPPVPDSRLLIEADGPTAMTPSLEGLEGLDRHMAEVAEGRVVTDFGPVTWRLAPSREAYDSFLIASGKTW